MFSDRLKKSLRIISKSLELEYQRRHSQNRNTRFPIRVGVFGGWGYHWKNRRAGVTETQLLSVPFSKIIVSSSLGRF